MIRKLETYTAVRGMVLKNFNVNVKPNFTVKKNNNVKTNNELILFATSWSDKKKP